MVSELGVASMQVNGQLDGKTSEPKAREESSELTEDLELIMQQLQADTENLTERETRESEDDEVGMILYR